MRRFFLSANAALAALLLLGGCVATRTGVNAKIAVEPLGRTDTRDILNKELHTLSLQQLLLNAAAKRGARISFQKGSDDAILDDRGEDYDTLVMRILNRPDLRIEGDFLLMDDHKITLKSIAPSPYKQLFSHTTTPQVVLGDKHSGKYIIEYRSSDAAKIAESFDFARREPIRIGRFMNKLYDIAGSEGKRLYFYFNTSLKTLFVEDTPRYFRLTPYKRQYLINYLSAAGVPFLAKGDNVAIGGNFTQWVEGMSLLHKLTKYRHMVYGIYEGGRFYELVDSTPQKSPIVVEFLGWRSDGKREYNIYTPDFHRKITTNKRLYVHYKPDGSHRFIIRFY